MLFSKYLKRKFILFVLVITPSESILKLTKTIQFHKINSILKDFFNLFLIYCHLLVEIKNFFQLMEQSIYAVILGPNLAPRSL